MLRNFLLITLRTIIRQKGYSLINILGLSTGMACTLLILLWVQDELSFDRFHDNARRLYRVEEDQHYSGSVYHVNVTPYPSGPVWKDEIPEIEDACRYHWPSGMLFRYGDQVFYERNTVAVDPSFLTMFSFPLLQGDINTALSEPYSAVLTEKTALKYFGEDDPMGKSLNVNNTYEFTVTGIMKDLPGNTIISFDILIPFKYLQETGQYSDHWGSNSIRTYVLLSENAIIDSINSKLTGIYHQHLPEGETDFMVAPFSEIHLHEYWGYSHTPGAIVYIYIFSAIALFVLLIACINFMNLTTARSANRAREIGLRKTYGAFRRNIVTQFLSESVLLTVISFLVAFLILSLVIPGFNHISGKELTMNHIFNYRFILECLAITLITGLIAGSYPSLFLSSFRPASIMKGELSGGSRSGTLRKILVVFQFTLSVGLATGSIIVYKQLEYMRNKDLGYNKNHLMYIPIRGGNIQEKYYALKDELLKESMVLGVSATTHTPSNIGSNSSGVDWEGKDPEMNLLVGTNAVDFDYTEVTEIEITRGRSFSKQYPGDMATDTTGRFLINEEMARIMAMDDPVGMRFDFMGLKGIIIGVMKDFHYSSTKYRIEPLAFAVAPPEWFSYMIIRIAPDRVPDAIEAIKDIWDKIIPAYPIEYHFLDEDFDRMYRTEERMSILLKYFTVLALIIACLGLFGLASFTAEQKTREIGIRKVMGANIATVILLMLRESVILVLVSCILGSIVSWFLMNDWLQDFAYRSSVDWWIFVLASFAAMFIAILAVGYQATRAALTYPAEALRYE
jgi:predicted permease